VFGEVVIEVNEVRTEKRACTSLQHLTQFNFVYLYSQKAAL